MKTTVNIPDSLLKAAKKLAAREKTTVSALIEQGLLYDSFLWTESGRANFDFEGPRSKAKGFNQESRQKLGTRFVTWITTARADDDVVRELWTADRDFGRFPTLTTRNPLVTS